MSIQNRLITNKNGTTFETCWIRPELWDGVNELKHQVHYSIQGMLTFAPLYASLEEYQEMTGYEFIFEDDLYADVLGIDDTYLIDRMEPMDSIQVCAGDWIKICEGWWTFEPDPEW